MIRKTPRFVYITGSATDRTLVCSVSDHSKPLRRRFHRPTPASTRRLSRVLSAYRPSTVLLPGQIVLHYHISGPIVTNSANYVNSEPAK